MVASIAGGIDVPAWIESRDVSRTQILVVVLMGLTAALDGFDAQMIGYVAPAVMRDLQVGPAQFTAVFAFGLFGLLLGCLVIAPLADWVGRKRILVLSAIFFGLMSLLTAWAWSLEFVDRLALLDRARPRRLDAQCHRHDGGVFPAPQPRLHHHGHVQRLSPRGDARRLSGSLADHALRLAVGLHRRRDSPAGPGRCARRHAAGILSPSGLERTRRRRGRGGAAAHRSAGAVRR